MGSLPWDAQARTKNIIVDIGTIQDCGGSAHMRMTDEPDWVMRSIQVQPNNASSASIKSLSVRRFPSVLDVSCMYTIGRLQK